MDITTQKQLKSNFDFQIFAVKNGYFLMHHIGGYLKRINPVPGFRWCEVFHFYTSPKLIHTTPPLSKFFLSNPQKKEPFLTLGKNRGKYRSNGDFPYKILIYVVGWEISYKGAGGEIRGRNS